MVRPDRPAACAGDGAGRRRRLRGGSRRTDGPWLVLGAFAGTGLAYGAVSALVPAVTADRVVVCAFPRAYGRVFTGWGCAGLVAPLAGGVLTGAGAQRPALALIAVGSLLPAVAALCLLAVPGRRRAGGSVPT